MRYCTGCGTPLSGGRFCTNCGAPVAPPAVESPAAESPAAESPAEQTRPRMPAVTDDGTAIRPRVPDPPPPPRDHGSDGPPPPPSVPTPPGSGGARFPLYADEVHAAPGTTGPTPPPPPASEPGHRDRRRRGAWPWLVAAVVILLLAGGTYWFGLRDDSSDDGTTTADDQSTAETTQDGASDPATPDGDETQGDDPTAPTEPPTEPEDVTDGVDASGPRPVQPGQALDGSTVRYPASNMLDDDDTTAYRIPGNARGDEIVFRLPEKTEITEVGLVNGYAKRDTAGNRTVDWYAKNRKVMRVEWVFDDGTTVTQELRRTTDLQVVSVDAASTRTIRMRILSVSPPGPGPLGKNVTAISTVRFRGAG